jgi:hypothetical protein
MGGALTRESYSSVTGQTHPGEVFQANQKSQADSTMERTAK